MVLARGRAEIHLLWIAPLRPGAPADGVLSSKGDFRRGASAWMASPPDEGDASAVEAGLGYRTNFELQVRFS